MLRRVKHQGFHLRTTLVFTYFLVALVAVIAAVGVALPLLQNYQEGQVQETNKRAVLDYARGFDTIRNTLLNTNPKTNTSNPFRDYFATNLTPNAAKATLTWPTNPSIETLRQYFATLANGRRLLVLTDRDHEVKVDTETDPNLSLEGETLPDVKMPPAPTPQPTGSQPTTPPIPQAKVTTSTGRQLTLIYRSIGGTGAPNLFGLNTQGTPIVYILAMYVPVEHTKEVWGDLTLILALPALIALALSLLAGFLLARNLSHPLVRLTQATHAVARGDYEQQVLPEGGYELHQLAQSFNQMTLNVAESQRMQRQLIANVSHELKTPLTSIQGFSQAMVDGALRRPADFARPAEIISNETARMIRLVNGLLELSKLESGQAALYLHELDLAETLRNCIESFMPKAEANQVTLTARFGPSLIVKGDSDRLRQVFNNLIDNALKYTPAEGRIEVKARRQAVNIVISVSDTGSGIPAVDLPHIFERFYQADKSRRRDLAVEGSGLGLAISKEIVLAHGGKIDATSHEGSGTTFQVMLPAQPPVQPPTEESRLSPLTAELVSHPSGN